MSNQTSEAIAYIEREYKDVKGRVELQRHVVAQLHMVEADASEAEASLNALLDDEASKLRILDYLRKWLGDKLEECHASLSAQNVTTTRHSRHWQLAVKEVNPLPRYLLAAMTSTSTRTSGLIN